MLDYWEVLDLLRVLGWVEGRLGECFDVVGDVKGPICVVGPVGSCGCACGSGWWGRLVAGSGLVSKFPMICRFATGRTPHSLAAGNSLNPLHLRLARNSIETYAQNQRAIFSTLVPK